MRQQLLRALALIAVCALALQLAFVVRIAVMRFVDPQSTSFQRSEAWRLLSGKGQAAWAQEWLPIGRLGRSLPRAVVASEDAGFAEHFGIDWEAVETAWEKNRRAQSRVQRQRPSSPERKVSARIVGGSTITQQLAKNLLLSGERTVARKAQEFVLTMALEGLLPKRRILEIYLNNVEWGEGLFGAQAAARYYFRVDAERLSDDQAARLAVMLPAPKRFERQLGSAYVSTRAAVIASRMGAVELP